MRLEDMRRRTLRLLNRYGYGLCLDGLCLNGLCLNGLCLNGLCLNGLCLDGLCLATHGIQLLHLRPTIGCLRMQLVL